MSKNRPAKASKTQTIIPIPILGCDEGAVGRSGGRAGGKGEGRKSAGRIDSYTGTRWALGGGWPVGKGKKGRNKEGEEKKV